MIAPLQRVRDALLTSGSTRSGSSGWTCPAHHDSSASLSVTEGRDGRVLLKCHTGCSVDDILLELHLTKADLFPPRDPSTNGSARPTLIKAYDYTDEHGELLFQALRFIPKDFRQRRRPRPTDPPDTIKRGWVYNLAGTRRVLYRLPQLLAAVKADQEIWIAEGEKDVAALEAAGAVATCNPMGAGKWLAEYANPLAGARVTIVADNDDPGRAHAQTVAHSLRKAGCTVRTVHAATGKDAHDHLTAGLALADFLPLEAEEPRGNTAADSDTDQPTAEHPESGPEPAPLAVEIHDFLASDDPEYDWLIPGLLERGDRVILTGTEGSGKSTLLRQLTIQAGAGIHPFTLEQIDPVRVLYVDLENAHAHVRRQLRPFAAAAGDKLGRDLVYVTVEPAGIDLLHQGNVDWLTDRVTEAEPTLVIIGPLYKMASGDPTSEEVARRVSAILDALRTTYTFALILEAHSPHAPAGGRRPVRPYGASMWLRWPEFGIYLAETGGLTHWRGPRDEREWPSALKRGGAWKWTAVDNPRDELFHRIVSHAEQAGHMPTQQVLAEMLNVSRSAVHRAIKANQAMYDQVKRAIEERPA